MTKKPIQVITLAVAVGVVIGLIVFYCVGDTPLVERSLNWTVILLTVCGVAVVVAELWRGKRGIHAGVVGLVVILLSTIVRFYWLDSIRQRRPIYQGGRVLLFLCAVAGLYLVLNDHFKNSHPA